MIFRRGRCNLCYSARFFPAFSRDFADRDARDLLETLINISLLNIQELRFFQFGTSAYKITRSRYILDSIKNQIKMVLFPVKGGLEQWKLLLSQSKWLKSGVHKHGLTRSSFNN
jgi:hypothetical protein